MDVNLYPGAVVYINGISGQTGSMSCFCYRDGSKGLFAVTSAHVVCVEGNPTKDIVAIHEVLAPLPPAYSRDPAARIRGKDADSDIALLEVCKPELLKRENFCLGGVPANGEIVGTASPTVDSQASIWGGLTTERSTVTPKPIVTGVITKHDNDRVTLKGTSTKPGDSGSPMYVASGQDHDIIAVFGNGGHETAPPYSNFGQDIASALLAAGKILGGTALLATWANRDRWL